MAITDNKYTGDGSAVLFSFTFPYLETTDIKVTLDGVITTEYILANATQIQFNTAPANGAAIRIFRDTDDETLPAQFYPGSAIRAQDLNDNFTQNLYVVQEVNNNALTNDGSNPMVGDFNLGGFKVTNLAAPVADTDAVNRAYVNDIVNSGIGDGDKGDIVVSGSGTTLTIDSGAITNSKVNASAGIVSSKLAFTQEGTGAVQRTVESKLQDTVSVLDFIPQSEHAAIKAGTTTYDATAAIQAAIDTGNTAYVPKGIYLISATLNLNDGYKALIGDSSMPIIAKTTAGPAIRIGTTSGAAINEYSRVENLYLQSIAVAPSFPANPTPNDAAVLLDGSSSSFPAAVGNARVINVRVGNWSCGFYTTDVVGVRIEGCFVQVLTDFSALPGFTSANKFVGFALDGTPYTPGGISPQASIELVDNDVTGAGIPTAVTSIGYYVVGSDIRDIFFDRCETSQTSYGWLIVGTTYDFNWDIHIRRPIVDAFKIYGIAVTDATGVGAITIDGGYFVGTGASAGACIYAINSNGITVTGGAQLLGLVNDLPTDDGVRFDVCNSCSVVGNNFVNLNFGVSLNGAKNCTVTGNHFYAEATDTEPHPTLYDAIRLFNGAEENTLVGNVIKGKDGTDQYDNGITVAPSCPRNVIVGNCVDETTVANAYVVLDTTTTLLSSDALQISANNVLLKSNNDRLILQGADPTYPIVFRNGIGDAIAKIDNAGVYSTGAP